MVVLAGHKFAKRISPSGPLVDSKALTLTPLKTLPHPGWIALRPSASVRIDCAGFRAGFGLTAADTQVPRG